MAGEQNRGRAVNFMCDTVQPAFSKLENELRSRSMVPQVVPKETSMTIHVAIPGERGDFQWTVEAVCAASGVVVLVTGTDVRTHRIQRDGQTLSISDISEKDIIDDFTEAHERWSTQ